MLPIWPFVGWGLFGDSGWSLAGLFIAMPILAIAMLVVSLLISARASVRDTKLVSWTDVGLLALWHVSIIGFGFFSAGIGIWAVLGILTGLAAFWSSIGQLISETSARTKAAMAEFERAAAGGPSQFGGPQFGAPGQFGGGPQFRTNGDPSGGDASGFAQDGPRQRFAPAGDAEVIIVQESKPDERH